MMQKHDKIYVAGHRGLAGSAMLRKLQSQGFDNLITRTHRELGMSIRWEGEGVDEKGYCEETGKMIVAVDPRYFRPTEVETLLGDPRKAREQLGWTPETSFEELVAEMVREDLKTAERDELCQREGFKTFNYFE